MAFAGPTSPVKNVEINQSSLRDRLFAKMRSPSRKKKGKKKKRTSTPQASFAPNMAPSSTSSRGKRVDDWTRRNSANSETNWIRSLSRSHMGYHAENHWEHSITDTGRDLDFKHAARRSVSNRSRSAPKIRRGRGGAAEKGRASKKSEAPRSAPRHQTRKKIHLSKSDLLGFTGNEKLHREYEKQRIEHRGGTHNLTTVTNRGGSTTWGASTYGLEDQMAIHTADNKSYYQRNRDFEDLKVPTKNSNNTSSRFDMDLLESLMGPSEAETSATRETPKKKKKKKKKTMKKKTARRYSPRSPRPRTESTDSHVRSPKRKMVAKALISRLRKQLGGLSGGLRKRFDKVDKSEGGNVPTDLFFKILQSLGIEFTKLESLSLLECLDADRNEGRINFEAFLDRVTVNKSPPRRRIHHRKASLLGFTGDERLHSDYERHRLERRGGAHDAVEMNRQGGAVAWGAKTFNIEDRMAIHSADDRSYYQRFRDVEVLKVDPKNVNDVSHRIDVDLLNSFTQNGNGNEAGVVRGAAQRSRRGRERKKKRVGNKIREADRPGVSRVSDRGRIHHRKASLLGFTGDEELHQAYESDRIESRGGAHDVPEADRVGGYVAWGPKTYKTEERAATHTLDNRSYYRRNRRRGGSVDIPETYRSSASGRFDPSLLNELTSSS